MGTVRKSNRIEWIDVAKGIGLICVILGHLHMPYLATWIYFFHMPLFFFLSGVVYSGKKYTLGVYFQKKAKSLLIPYVIFGMIIWLFYVIVNFFVDSSQRLYGSNLDMLKGLVVQEHFWTIWFLTALFGVEILYFLIDHFFKNKKIYISVVSLLICIWGLIRYRLGLGALPWNLDIVLVAQLFFHVGRLFKENNLATKITEKPKKMILVQAIVSFLLSLVAGGIGIKIACESLDMSVGLYGNEMLTFIAALAGILFIVSISNLINWYPLIYLGRNTMIIFALHSRIVIVLCRYIYDYLGIFQGDGFVGQILCAIVTFVIILLILVPMTELIKKSKGHALFGV